MKIKQDFLSYHQSIGQELKSSKERIRNLIGATHWVTDGEHKESILRKVISDFAPEIFRVGTGFVCYPGARKKTNSGQLDILITSKVNPTLYKSGELHFVTPDCANAIIEVKSKIHNLKTLERVIAKLSYDIEAIRNNSSSASNCWAGLFIFDEGRLTDKQVLKVLQKVTSDDIAGAINCVAIGENQFIRFWRNGYSTSQSDNDPIWHSYIIKGLSHAYFVSNLVSNLSSTWDDASSKAWFPIRGSKEFHRFHYAILADREVHEFSRY